MQKSTEKIIEFIARGTTPDNVVAFVPLYAATASGNCELKLEPTTLFAEYAPNF